MVGAVEGGLLPDGLCQLVHGVHHGLFPAGQLTVSGGHSPVGVLAQGLAVGLLGGVDVVRHARRQLGIPDHLLLRCLFEGRDLLRG